jgi:hypothetical protein
MILILYEYDINDKFYLEQIYKEIKNILPKQKTQLNLFEQNG